jgi:DNA-binding response OmpR family regulator
MSQDKTILLVDDDSMNGNLLKKRLDKRGFNCLFVQSAQECFDIMETQHIDLILLDIMMPEITGIEALIKIRETMNGFALPIIMVTARDDSRDVVDGLHNGANDYLTKPVNIDIAVARIKTQLQIKGLFEERIKTEQINTINTMVTTLNHEINNPLAIAIGNLSLGFDKLNEQRVGKALNALDRITKIVKKIEALTSEEMEEVSYSTNVNMYKLK